MSAFFVATVTIKHPEKFQECAQRAAEPSRPTVEKRFSEGRLTGALVGSAGHQPVGIVTFPDAGVLSAWFSSPAYQALVPLRDEAADITIITYSIPA